MNDNFDLRKYLGSKRLLTENFQPISEKELDENMSDIIPYDELIELARKAKKVVIDAGDALLELAIINGKNDGVSREDVEDTLAEYDMTIEDLEEYEDEINIDDIPDANLDDDEPEPLDESEEDIEAKLMKELDEVEEPLNEAKKKPSAGLSKKQRSAIVKKARAGKDIGKKGKGFEKVEKAAAKEYGSEEAGKKVAAAAMFKNAKR